MNTRGAAGSASPAPAIATRTGSTRRATSRPRATARYYSAHALRVAPLRRYAGAAAAQLSSGRWVRSTDNLVGTFRGFVAGQDRAHVARRLVAGRLREARRGRCHRHRPRLADRGAARHRSRQRCSASGSGATGRRGSWIPPARTPASRSAGADRRFDSWRHARSCGRRPSAGRSRSTIVVPARRRAPRRRGAARSARSSSATAAASSPARRSSPPRGRVSPARVDKATWLARRTGTISSGLVTP